MQWTEGIDYCSPAGSWPDGVPDFKVGIEVLDFAYNGNPAGISLTTSTVMSFTHASVTNLTGTYLHKAVLAIEGYNFIIGSGVSVTPAIVNPPALINGNHAAVPLGDIAPGATGGALMYFNMGTLWLDDIYFHAGAIGFDPPHGTGPGPSNCSILAVTPGDINEDGIVNVADLSILGTHYKTSGQSWAGGDVNGDGLVNVSDLAILGTHYTGSSGGGNLPEPATLLLLLALSATIRRRR